MLLFDLQAAFEKDIMMLRDTGILTKMQFDIMSPETYRPDPKVRYDPTISIYEMATAFMAGAVGILMGIVCFLFELCKGKSNKKPPLKSTRNDSVIFGNSSHPHRAVTGNLPTPVD